MSGGRKENLVQFTCHGRELAERKNCTGYIEDGKDGDCAGLKNPVTGEREGVCWSPKALFMKSAAFLQYWDVASMGNKPVGPQVGAEEG